MERHDDRWSVLGAERRLRRNAEREKRERLRRRQRVTALATLGVVIAIAMGALAMAQARPLPDALTVKAAAVERPVTQDAVVPSATPTPVVAIGETSSVEPTPVVATTKPKKAETAQRFSIKIGEVGYEPSVVRATVGSPITLIVAKGEGCAAGFLMPSLGIAKDNSSGAVTIRLGRLKAGSYQFSCGMGMVTGRLVVR